MLELAAIASIILLCAYLLCAWRQRRYKLPPGPSGLPVFGTYFRLDSERPHHVLTEWAKEFGPIYRTTVLGTSIVTLTSAMTIRRALDMSPTDRHLNDRSKNSTSDVFHGRKHIGCANLTKETLGLRDFHICGIQKYFDGDVSFEIQMKSEIKNLHLNLITKPGHNVNPHSYLRIFYRNIFANLLIGETLPDDDPDQGMLWEFIDNLYTMIDPSIDGPLRTFPWLRLLPGKYGNAFRQTIASRDKVAKRFFDDHKLTYVAGSIRGLVDVCIKTQADEMASGGNTWLSDEYIKGLIYDTLAAGMTELMKTLRLFILLMCHHPDVQCRLQTEIDAVIGTDKFPSADDQQWMPYTTAAILELLRYGSQTPLAIPHRCNKDVILDGYLIQEGTLIFPNLWGVHHDETIWGDPWTFRPERFLTEDGSLLPSDHTLMTNVIPFGVGKRACPGQTFAKSRTFICIASLLQRVQFAPPEGCELPSADSRLYTRRYPLSEPDYTCRVLSRENIII